MPRRGERLDWMAGGGEERDMHDGQTMATQSLVDQSERGLMPPYLQR